MSMGCLGNKKIYLKTHPICRHCNWEKECVELVEGKMKLEEQEHTDVSEELEDESTAAE